MAIIKYQLVNRTIPSYITDSGLFHHGDDFIGIGSGGGTELSKSELHTLIMTWHNNYVFKHPNSAREIVAMTDAEVTTMVNDWCTEKGIS